MSNSAEFIYNLGYEAGKESMQIELVKANSSGFKEATKMILECWEKDKDDDKSTFEKTLKALNGIKE